jgi:hypothetical protein
MAVSRHRMRHGTTSRVVACLLLLAGLKSAPAQQPERSSANRAAIPLFTGFQDQFSGKTGLKEYFVRLPEHVSFRSTSELKLVLHPSSGLLPRVCIISLAVNGRLLMETNLQSTAIPPGEGIEIHASIPEPVLAGGWNKFSLRFALQQPGGSDPTPQGESSWELLRAESFVSLAFERQALFPELARFPHTFAEERLLQPDTDSPFIDPVAPVLSILIPGRSGEVHLRAAAIVAARMGQLGYLGEGHCRIEALEFWKTETDRRNGIIIGRRDQLGGIQLPANVAAALASLKAGQGIVAEFVHHARADEHRVMLISGADDAGMDKAALTVGSSPALLEAAPNPAIIEEIPKLPAALAAQVGPGPASSPFAEKTPIPFRALHVSEQAVSTWRLPPAFRLGAGSSLYLEYAHSPALLEDRSWLEVMLNGASIGRLPLRQESAASSFAHVPLPEGLPGRDPMVLSFRANLDLAQVQCEPAKEEQAWLTILGTSTLETTVEPIPVDGLNQIQAFLLADAFGRKAAFAVPASPSLEQVRQLFTVWLEFGQRLPSSPILWPEVVTYQPGSWPASTRLKDRSVLFLGAVAQWPASLPGGGKASAVRMVSLNADTVTIQGREHRVDAFDPTLVLAEMLRSPWSDKETVMLVGGWKDYATPTLKRLLLEPGAADQLRGNLGAFDQIGRSVGHQTRRVTRESFAELVQSRMREGLTPEQSARMASAQEEDLARSQRWNRIVFYGCGAIFLALVLARLFFMWEQARVRKFSLEADKAAGGIT